MDTVLQEKLVEIIELGQVGALKAVEILKEQAPELLRQFMAFETFSASAGILLGIVLLIIGIIALLHLKKMKWDLDAVREFATLMVAVVSGVIGIVTTIANGYTLAKILIAPNLYIIQHLLTVLK